MLIKFQSKGPDMARLIVSHRLRDAFGTEGLLTET